VEPGLVHRAIILASADGAMVRNTTAVSPRYSSATVTELARAPLLAALPGETLRKLAAAMEREDVAAGAELVREGEYGDRFYVVLTGMFSVAQEARGERRMLRPGDNFGEVALMMGPPRTASVRAVMPSTVASCDRAAFDEFVRPLFVDRERAQ
jgi:ATP-binding cassette subfamily B protein